MDMKDVIEFLPADESFTKQQFSNIVREANADYSGSSVSWLLSELKRKQKIASIGRGVYVKPFIWGKYNICRSGKYV